MNQQIFLDYVNNWRAVKGIAGTQSLTTVQIQLFAQDLQSQISQFSVRPEGNSIAWTTNAQPLGYQGSIDNIPNWRIAEAIAHGSNGKVFYISDTPAGDILNVLTIKNAVRDVIGGVDSDFGEKVRINLYEGAKDVAGNTTPYGVGNLLSLNSFVSQKMMSEGAYGDMRILATDIAPNSVLATIEIPDMLFNPRVTHINGIPKDLFLDILNSNGGIESGMPSVLKAVSATSTDLVANLKIIPDALGSVGQVESALFYEGSPQYGGVTFSPNTANILELDVLPKLSSIQNADFVEGMESLQESAGRLSSRFANAGGLEPVGTQALLEWGVQGLNKFVGRAGLMAVGITGVLAVNESQQAFNSGDYAKATGVLVEYAAELTGALAGAAAGSTAAAGYFFWLEAVPVVGTAAHGVVTLAGGLGGAYLGAKGVEAVKDVVINAAKRLATTDVGEYSDPMGTGDMAAIMGATSGVSSNLVATLGGTGSSSIQGNSWVNTNIPTPVDPTRPSSSSFVQSNGVHSVIIGPPVTDPVTGKVWSAGLRDAWVNQLNSPNGFSDWNEFLAAAQVSNPAIVDSNKVKVGQIVFLPQKMPDGSTTYHFAGGSALNKNLATGEYFLSVPDGKGGVTIYKGKAEDSGYSVDVASYDKNGELTNQYKGWQATLKDPVKPINAEIKATNPDGTLATGADAKTADVEFDEFGRRLVITNNADGTGTAQTFEGDVELSSSSFVKPGGINGTTGTLTETKDGKTVVYGVSFDGAGGDEDGDGTPNWDDPDYDLNNSIKINAIVSVNGVAAVNADEVNASLAADDLNLADLWVRYVDEMGGVQVGAGGGLNQAVASADASNPNGIATAPAGGVAWYNTETAQALGGLLTGIQSMMAALQSGKPLAIATSFFNLAASLSRDTRKHRRLCATHKKKRTKCCQRVLNETQRSKTW